MNNAVQTTSSDTARSQPAPQQEQQQQPFVVPPVDIFEDDHAITLLADLPGVQRDQLHLRIDGETLVLEATARTNGPGDMQLVYGEAQCPTYRRQFTLSRELDTERVQAQLRDGVLRLTIPKSEDARPRRIQVQVG